MLTTPPIRAHSFRLGEWTVAPDSGTLSRGDESVRLQPKMMDVLIFLAENAGQVVAKEVLLDQIWNGTIVEEGALPQCIHALRKALGDDARRPSFIETIPRRGYRLIAPIQEIDEDADAPSPASPPLPLAGSLAPVPSRMAQGVLGVLLLSVAALLIFFGARQFKTLSDISESGHAIEPPHHDPISEAHIAFLRGKSQIESERQANVDFDKTKAYEAVESLKEAVAIDPKYGMAWAVLSRQYSMIYFNGSQTEELRQDALDALENAERLAPFERDTRLAQAYFYYHVEEDYAKAAKAFQQVPDVREPEVLFGFGLVLRRQGRFAEATEYMERAFRLDNQNDTLAGTLAKTYMGQRRYAEAEKWFQYALSINPDLPQLAGDRVMNAMAWKGCPENLRSPCSTREARDLLADMLPEIENKGYLSYFEFLLNLYDTTALSSDDRKTAYRAILEWLAGVPEDERNDQDRYTFFWRQVWLHRQLGEEVEAQKLISHFRELLQTNIQDQPKNAFHRSYMAMIYAFEGDAESAEASADKAIELRKDDLYSGIRHQEFRAVTLTLLGRHDAAIEQLEKVRHTSYQYAITPMHLRLEPVWEPLRGDPRFIALLQTSE